MERIIFLVELVLTRSRGAIQPEAVGLLRGSVVERGVTPGESGQGPVIVPPKQVGAWV